MTHLRQTLMPIGHNLVGHLFVQAAVEKAPTERLDIGVSAGQPRAACDRVALTCFLQVGADESRCCRRASTTIRVCAWSWTMP